MAFVARARQKNDPTIGPMAKGIVQMRPSPPSKHVIYTSEGVVLSPRVRRKTCLSGFSCENHNPDKKAHETVSGLGDVAKVPITVEPSISPAQRDTCDANTSIQSSTNTFAAQAVTAARELQTKGDEHFKRAAYGEAVAAYSASLQAYPLEADCWLSRSVARRQVHQWVGAAHDASRAAELNPSEAKAYAGAVLCWVTLNKFEEAIEACEAGLQQLPRSTALRRLRSETRRKAQFAQQQIIDSAIDRPLQVVTNQRSDAVSSCIVAAERIGTVRTARAEATEHGKTTYPCAAATKKETSQEQGAKVMRQAAACGQQMRRSEQSVIDRAAWIRRSKFTRHISRVWRLCHRRPPAPRQPKRMRLRFAGDTHVEHGSIKAKAMERDREVPSHLTRHFAPHVPDPRRCAARIWNHGQGGQCSKSRRANADFCWQHSRGECWRVHGRIDGPVPRDKLQEFLKWSQRTRRPNPLACKKRMAHIVAAREAAATPAMQMRVDAPGAIADAVPVIADWGALQAARRSSRFMAEESVEVPHLTPEEPHDGSSNCASSSMTAANLLTTPCAAPAAVMTPLTEKPLPRRHSYVGSHVEVRGDGWGGGSGCYVGVVTEADAATFTVVVPAGPSPWNETHVLRQYCMILRPEPALGMTMKPKQCKKRARSQSALQVSDVAMAVARSEVFPKQKAKAARECRHAQNR